MPRPACSCGPSGRRSPHRCAKPSVPAKQSDGHRGEGTRRRLFAGRAAFVYRRRRNSVIPSGIPETGQKIRTLLGHAGPITYRRVPGSPAAARSASEDNTALCVWDVQTGQPPPPLRAHTDRPSHRHLSARRRQSTANASARTAPCACGSPQAATAPSASPAPTTTGCARRCSRRCPPASGAQRQRRRSTGRIWDSCSGSCCDLSCAGHPEWVNSVCLQPRCRPLHRHRQHGSQHRRAGLERRQRPALGHADRPQARPDLGSACVFPNGEMIVTRLQGQDRPHLERLRSGSFAALVADTRAPVTPGRVSPPDGREVPTASEDQTRVASARLRRGRS